MDTDDADEDEDIALHFPVPSDVDPSHLKSSKGGNIKTSKEDDHQDTIHFPEPPHNNDAMSSSPPNDEFEALSKRFEALRKGL